MLYLLLVLSLILCCIAASQHSALGQAKPAPGITAPAPPPLPPSPVDTFRRILAMSQPDREKFLATLASEKRQVVMLKLDEYQGMPAEQREQRLRALQVWVQVRQLIRLAPSNRVERLAAIAPTERKLVEERLAEWDHLPGDLQKEVLTNEIAIRYIARARLPYHPALPPFPADPKVAHEVAHWSNLSDARRSEVLQQVEGFLEEYSAEDRVKILGRSPNVKTSAAVIASLAKEQSDRYIEGFKRFNALSSDDQRRFLIKAAHWQKMSPDQRESWRVIIKKLSAASAPPPPPLPGRPSAAIVPARDHASVDLPSR